MDLSEFVPDSLTWWEIGLALVSIILGWILSRLASRGVKALARRTPGVSDSVARLAARLSQYGIMLLAIGVALVFLGANIQPLIAVVIVVAVVLVLVLRGIADNFAAGVLLQTRKPITVGHEIQVDGPDGLLTGIVSELNGRAVVLTTADGRTVHVPNGTLMRDPIVNDSSHGARRSEVQVRLERGEIPIEEMLTALTDAAATADGVHVREHPRALAVAVSPERLTARLQFWHHPLHGVPVTSAVVLAVAGAVDAAAWKGTVSSVAAPPPLAPADSV